MEPSRAKAEALTLLFLIVASVQGDFVEPLQDETSLRSLTDSQTRLPCHYKAKESEQVVQVTWYKELPDGSKDQIITAHFTDGHTEFGRYSGRVRFESSSPTVNSALLFPNTELSDEGTYICHISTFPNGNFERRIVLTVWSLPIYSLDSLTLVARQQFGVVASCRAVGHPLPHLSWDTDLPGQSKNRTSEAGAVSSHFSLYPERDMNGKKLDCLVSHPGLDKPRRISNRLVVQYPPDATISSSPKYWYVGLEKAELVCEGKGNPVPQNFTWRRTEGVLPNGVSVIGNKLIFERAVQANDSGIYECLVRNSLGDGTSEYILTVAAKKSTVVIEPWDKLLLIIIGSAAGAVVLILIIIILLVSHHHQHRNKKLKRELSEKTVEMDNLSRQVSFRRLNSISSELRVQGEDYAFLRVSSRMKHSQMSLERPIYKGSQSTLGGRWGPAGGVEVDELGRPVVWQDRGTTPEVAQIDGEREERRRRVESFVKSSNMSLDSGLPSSVQPVRLQQDDCTGPGEPGLGHLQDEDSRPEDDSPPSHSVDESHEDEDTNSYQMSAALNNYFYYHDGLLRPKPHSNAILLHAKPDII